MIDSKLNTIVKKKSKTITKVNHADRNRDKKKDKNKKKGKKVNLKKRAKVINIKRINKSNNKKTKKIKTTRKIKKFDKNTKKKIKQHGGNNGQTNTSTTTFNRNVEPTIPLRESLRFGDMLDQNVDKMDLGPKWPGKPPYPPDCCIM
jgi:hypothetical protein